MKKNIIISGFGGQGVMLAGNLPCNAAMKDERFVTFFPSYGAEMRGGTANCQVIISERQIGSPIVINPDICIIFNQPSYDRFARLLKPDGKMIINSSLVNENSAPNSYSLPATKIAEEMGSILTMNIVMIGAFAAITNLISLDNLKESIPEILKKKKNLWDINIAAAEAGYNTIK